MSVAGHFAVAIQTPLGEQRGTMTVIADAERFTGTVDNASGSLRIENGRVEGNRLRWTMAMTSPLPMTLDCEAQVVGDTIAGTVNAGAFGAMRLTGTRLAGAG